ncbi:MAG: VWA domain-containing protein [Rubripirellula sp.]
MGSIRFAGDLHPAFVIGAALAAACLVVWLYVRESRQVSSPYNFLLPGLRASAVALAILILAGPVWHRRQVVGTLGRVVFAVDASDSMNMTDSVETDSSPSRIDRALSMLSGKDEQAGWLESLTQTHEVDVIAFSAGEPSMVWSSSDDEELPTAFDLDANGQRTDLATGMATTLATLASQASDEIATGEESAANRAAVVLMSDGRDNVGRSPLELAERLQAAGVGVHAIGVGSEEDPIDVGIVNVIRPDTVASDGNLSGEIILRTMGNQTESDPSVDSTTDRMVRIESGGKVVWQRTVPAGAGPQQTIPFEIDVESIVQDSQSESPRGVRRSSVVMDLRAVVEPISGDTNAGNNALPFRVAASTRDRKLLILDGSSRWETRYLKNLFERDPAWTVDKVLYGTGTDMPFVKRGEESGQFPNTREAMSRYDAIILGEVPPDQFSETDGNLLRDFVTRGGGLIVIDGRYGRIKELAESTLPELIPVNYTTAQPFVVASLQPSRMGMDHPVLNLWGEKDELSEFWKNIPPPPIANAIEAQEGSEVWADAIGKADRTAPWLVTRLFGAGRVFYLSTDQTWRWRYKVADRFHARFWNQLLHAVMQPPYSASDDYVALGTDKIEYESGDSSTVRVRLQDTQGKPVGDATVDALLIAEDRVIATVPLSVDDPARGTYRGQTPPLEDGAYEIRIRASGFDANALQATTPIWVGTPDTVELGRVSLDKDALTQIAELGGGEYYHESSADQILETLKPLSSGSIIESDILIWQSFYWFWAIIALLAVEWWMRKRAGLV